MPTTLRIGVSALFVWLLLAVPQARADKWKVDETHSTAAFKVRHMMVANVRGQFSGISGWLEIDGDKLNTLKTVVEVDAKTINTHNAKRDEHLRSGDFFQADKFPKLVFKSKKVTPLKGGKFKLTGDLTMRGKTKEVTFEADKLTPPVKGMGGGMHRGLSATTKINRKDFGINWNKSLDNGGVVVGDEVDVTVELELIQEAGEKAAKKS